MTNVDLLERIDNIDADALDKIARGIFRDLRDKMFQLVLFAGLGDAPADVEDVYDLECIEVSQYDDDSLLNLF